MQCTVLVLRRQGLSVRLTVCLSVGVRALWQNDRNLCPHSYTAWKNIHPSFLTRRMVGGGQPFYIKFWAKLGENADFQSILYLLIAPQMWHLAKKFNCH